MLSKKYCLLLKFLCSSCKKFELFWTTARTGPDFVYLAFINKSLGSVLDKVIVWFQTYLSYELIVKHLLKLNFSQKIK
jgi:hypothetical protein